MVSALLCAHRKLDACALEVYDQFGAFSNIGTVIAFAATTVPQSLCSEANDAQCFFLN